jgi:hypothetical protein
MVDELMKMGVAQAARCRSSQQEKKNLDATVNRVKCKKIFGGQLGLRRDLKRLDYCWGGWVVS